MKKSITTLGLLLLLSFSAKAQNGSFVGNNALTNSMLVASNGGWNTKVYSITGVNTSNAPVYIMLFETNGAPVTGTVPRHCWPVAANTAYSLPIPQVGWRFSNLYVVASTNAATFSLAAGLVTMQAYTAVSP